MTERCYSPWEESCSSLESFSGCPAKLICLLHLSESFGLPQCQRRWIATQTASEWEEPALAKRCSQLKRVPWWKCRLRIALYPVPQCPPSQTSSTGDQW